MHITPRNKNIVKLLAATALCAAAIVPMHADAQDSPLDVAVAKDKAQAFQNPDQYSEFQNHIDMANMVIEADPNLKGMHTLCTNLADWGTFRKTLAQPQVEVTPTKVFDNLYYMGFNTVGSWAVVTKDGIIQIDALHNPDEAEKVIVPAYKKLGLDPSKIKYVILSHSHTEHWGGGKYFQDHGAKVVMGGPDWDVVAKAKDAPPPTKDIAVGAEPYKLTLGGETITLFLSPGHTPGALYMLIPVTDHGKPHVMAMVGGTGIPKGMESMIQYKNSMMRFWKGAIDAGADGNISNHFWFDNSYTDGKTDNTGMAKARKPGQPNPWVVGKDGVALSMVADLECLESSMARLKETNDQ